jgi:hypothetical protein
VAEGGGLLNRYRGSTSIVSSNLIPSANPYRFNYFNGLSFSEQADLTPILTAASRVRTGRPTPATGRFGDGHWHRLTLVRRGCRSHG